jgi:hypothetical protein
MQMNDRSTAESLPEVLDQALARLQAGESVEACLSAYPQHARDLEPLLRTGDIVHAQAAAPLPAEMEAWLSIGKRDFVALAAQMAPKSAQAARPRQAAKPSTQAQFDDVLDETLLRIARGEPASKYMADYPEHAAALDPLLRLGSHLRASAAMPLPAELEAWLPTGKRDFMAIAEQMAPRYAQRRRRAAARKLTAQRAGAAVAVVALMLGAVDTASAQSLPGDTLYTWKRAHENISLALTADPRERGQLFVEYAGRRLQEFNTLVATGSEVDSTLVAETLDSLLDNVQGALTTSQETQAPSVAPEVQQLLNETKSAISQAAVVAPDAIPVLDDARARADVLNQNIVTADAASTPTNTATPTSTATATDAGGGAAGGGDGSGSTAAPTSSVFSPPVATAVPPSATSPLGGPAPTLAAGNTAVPAASPTTAPPNTPTINPATVIPPTSGPTSAPSTTPTDAPAPPTASPTVAPTSIPTNTVVPSATPLPITDVPTVEPPPPTLTPRPTRPPLPTDTPVPPTDTPVTPTDTPVPPPTDTPEPAATAVVPDISPTP